jgi:hypothetical protein
MVLADVGRWIFAFRDIASMMTEVTLEQADSLLTIIGYNVISVPYSN